MGAGEFIEEQETRRAIEGTCGQDSVGNLVKLELQICWECCAVYRVTMSASSRTRSQDSFHASSQAVTGGAYEDTASSVHAGRQSRGSSVTQSQVAPNSAFAQ